jgi:hypothetical protein
MIDFDNIENDSGSDVEEFQISDAKKVLESKQKE